MTTARHLYRAMLSGKCIMLVNICCLPGIADPNIRHGNCCQISIVVDHVGWEPPFLFLIFVVQHEYREFCLFVSTLLLSCDLDVFFQFSDSILECCSSIVHLINNQNILADQIRHLERGEVEPLCPCDLCTGGFDRI